MRPHPVLALLACASLLSTSACSSSNPSSTSPSPVSPSPQPASTVVVERTATTVYGYQGPTYGSAVLTFPASSTGAASPTVNAQQTTSAVRGIALDGTGNLYVGKTVLANAPGYTVQSTYIEVYGPGFTATSSPIRTIALPNNDEAFSLFVDTTGQLFVLSRGSGTVYVFAAGASGSAQPVRTLTGAQTGIVAGQATNLSVDSSGILYVVNEQPAEILSFSSSATGNAAPLRTLTFASGVPSGVAVNSSGTLFVAVNVGTLTLDGTHTSTASIQSFPANSSGSASPSQTITGSATTLINSGGLRLDLAGNLWVVNLTQGADLQFVSHVVSFAAGASGNTAPRANFYSTAWGFGGPELAVE